MPSIEPSYSLRQKIAAWLVHAFTASGMVVGFFAIIAISQRQFALAFGFLFLTAIIDGIDGTLARWCEVEKVLPWISGKTMDQIIDFASYAIIPTYLLYMATQGGLAQDSGGIYLLPEALRGWAAAVILLTSTLYYAKKGMISDDLYFIGFPVLWNLVAFYLYYVLALTPLWNLILIGFFAVLHFIPLKYVYPSRTRQYRSLNILMSLLILGSNFMLMLLRENLYDFPSLLFPMRALSLISLGYFAGLSLWISYGPGQNPQPQANQNS